MVPPLINVQIISHFFHRVFALLATLLVIGIALWVMRQGVSGIFRRLAWSAVALVVAQVALGVASVLTILAVPPVTLHTLVAAALLANLVTLSTLAGRA
jgi:heme A synthase